MFTIASHQLKNLSSQFRWPAKVNPGTHNAAKVLRVNSNEGVKTS